MKGKSVFTESEASQLRKLIAELSQTSDRSGKEGKRIRAKMRAIGFYIRDDWGINDCQPEDFEDLIRTGRIRII